MSQEFQSRHGVGPRPVVPGVGEIQKNPTLKERWIRKNKEDPFVTIGLIGTAAALVYGGYAYKNRGPMSTSRYLMRLRVIAQSAVVFSMILGAGWSSLRTRPTRAEQ